MATKARPPDDQAMGQRTEVEAEASPDDRGGRAAIAEGKLAEAEDKLLRCLAEQENVRRIAAREREDAVRFANANLTADLLETVDNLQRAIKSGAQVTGGGNERLMEGLIATERGLIATLERYGVKPIYPMGERFDPDRHHAVYDRADSTADEGTVIEVLQPGYLMHDRLLRAALVGVASGKPAND